MNSKTKTIGLFFAIASVIIIGLTTGVVAAEGEPSATVNIPEETFGRGDTIKVKGTAVNLDEVTVMLAKYQKYDDPKYYYDALLVETVTVGKNGKYEVAIDMLSDYDYVQCLLIVVGSSDVDPLDRVEVKHKSSNGKTCADFGI